MPSDRTLRQIREARVELRNLNRDLDRFSDRARTAGAKGGRGFGQRFKSLAIAGAKEMARGAVFAVGEHLARKFLNRGEQGGRAYGRGFKSAAKRELDNASTGGAGGGLFSSANLWKGAAIGAAAVGLVAGKAFIGSVKEAMAEERLTMSFESLGDSVGGGGRLFESLRQDALRTGVDIEGMSDNVRKFLAMGFDETAAMKLNRSILDVAGGMGLTTTDAKLLGMALSQVAAKGVASMEELRGQIAERGVPVFELLAGKLQVTQAELFKLIAAGKVTSDTLIEGFSNLEGPLAKFAGGADRLGKTGGGLFARIGQQAEDLKRAFGAAILPELKPILEDAIGLIAGMKEQAKLFGEEVAAAIGFLRAGLQELSAGEIFQLAGLALKEAFLSAMDVLARGMVAIFASFQRADFLTGLEQRMREAALIFKEELLRGMSAVFAAVGQTPGMGFMGEVGEEMSRGADAASWNRDRDRRLAERNNRDYDPLSILKDEFAKVGSMFGLSDQDKTTMDRLIGRVKKRRAQNQADQVTPEPAPSGGDSTQAPAQKAPFDPSGLIGGGIANALSLIGGGGSTVILQKQVDLATETNRKIDATNAKLDQVITNTKQTPTRGPLKTRPTFS